MRYRLVKCPICGERGQYGSDRKVVSSLVPPRRFPLATLQDLLLTPENGPRLIADTQALVDNEISSKGITAAPLKAAYKVVTAFAPGYYQDVIEGMLPGMVYQLEPY